MGVLVRKSRANQVFLNPNPLCSNLGYHVMLTDLGRQTMKLNKPNVVIAAAASDTGSDRQDANGGGRPGDDERATPGAGNRQPAEEAVSVSGIAADDLSPEVQQAIGALSGEIERLRRELEWSRSREAKLVRLADTHATLPILGRRAFVRELTQVLDHAGQLATPASLVALHLVNGEDIRRRLGRRAADQALSQVCRTIVEVLHATDKIGGLGGYDFGVILLVADLDAALDKANALIGAIGEHPFSWQDENIPLAATTGISVIEEGTALETVMANAERNLADSEKRLTS